MQSYILVSYLWSLYGDLYLNQRITNIYNKRQYFPQERFSFLICSVYETEIVDVKADC